MNKSRKSAEYKSNIYKSENLMCNMVTIFDNTVLHNWNFLRVDLKGSHTQKINMWCDECVNELDGKNPFTIKSLWCML